MKNKKRMTAAIAAVTATFAAAAAMETFAYNYGPGAENYNVTIYEAPSDNNPAYNNGWSGGVGPGATGSNPMGWDENEEDALSGGPNSDAAKKYLSEEENAFYIHSTYQGGTWEQQEDGRWKLLKPDGQPVSSQWAYVDGKTYLVDMYGIMQTGWQKVNDNWYYFNSVGAMQTGWLLKNGKYYFLNSDGTMAYGWVNSQGNWYYFDRTTGAMATNTYTPDGRYVSAEGVLVQ